MHAALLPLFLTLSSAATPEGDTLLVEAERFEDRGGWVVDSQFMDQMGSPFLLAHGLGVPVADARTTVRVAEAGEFRIWVRTRDWVATWDASGAPGRFQLLVNDRPLSTTFGTEGALWHWQDGGVVALDEAVVRLGLHDLTGFEGRVDAVLLSRDLDFVPPEGRRELIDLRGELFANPAEAGEYDLVVTGGGIAGICASLAAARLGLTVALIQDRPVLGGNNSSEVRVWLNGARNVEPWPRVGDVVRELEQNRRAHYGPENSAEIYEDSRKQSLVEAEPHLSLFLQHRGVGVETIGGRIHAVFAQHTITGQMKRFAGRWFVDATGDGCIGSYARADHEQTDKGHMGRCNLWSVADTGEVAPFPRCPWALDLTDKPFPGRAKEFPGVKADRRGVEALGGWYWESGFDHDPFEKSEYIRDWNLRAMYGAWDALKNVDGRYPNHALNWAAYVSGKRESRRLLGDVVLTREDVLNGVEYPDGCVPTGWAIDLHLPDPRYEPGFEGDAFISVAHYDHYQAPYWIPYRCLYSRNIPNLFMAGRDISVTHEALGTVRVMRTGGCMGEIVGMAASICRKHDVDARDVYETYLEELKGLMKEGVGKPGALSSTWLSRPDWLDDDDTNLALAATVRVSSCRDPESNRGEQVNDGRLDLEDNAGRWLSAPGLPDRVELSWKEPRTISAARVVSGYSQGWNGVTDPLRSFTFQLHDGTGWRDVPGAAAEDNTEVDWSCRFEPITTDRIRLLVTATQLGISRVWEVEVY